MTNQTPESVIAEARKLLEDYPHYQEYPGGPLLKYPHQDVAGRLADALEAANELHDPKNLSIMNGWLVEFVGEHTCGTGPDGYYGAHEPDCGYEPLVNLAELEGWPEAERDAALAAVERVRAEHSKSDYDGGICLDCEKPWPCSTLAALDGAPEPEVKP